MLIATALPLGLLIGLAMGGLGGGGSVLAVPVLVYAVGQDPRTATTSSLLIVGLTSLVALLSHAREGRVRFGSGLLFGALGTAGSVAGSALSNRVPGPVLLVAFAALMAVVATLMFRHAGNGRNGAEPGTRPPEPILTLRPLHCACPRAVKLLVTATLVGLLTGFFGVGGGFAVVPALVLALGFPMPAAVGTSLLVIAVNSATALGARLVEGHQALDWSVIGAFTAAAVVGSLVGARVMTRTPPQRLIRAFAVLVAGVATYTAVQAVPALI